MGQYRGKSTVYTVRYRGYHISALKNGQYHTYFAHISGAPIRKDITISEVKQHSKPYDGWIILRGKVYNITPYLAYHPGGSAIIENCLGKDATSLFDKYHSWVNIDNLVGDLLIGYLIVEKPRMAKINDDDDDDDLEDDSRGTILPTAATSSAKTSIRSTNDSNNIEFAMPKPRPPKGKPIGSLLSKDGDDGEEDDALLKL